MKRLLFTIILLTSFARIATAVDHIGIYRDATAQSCSLDPGYNNSVVVMHRYAFEADWSHFRVDFSNAPGSVLITFDTPYATVGSLTEGMFVWYAGCLDGDIVVGTITAILNAGYIEIAAPDGYPEPEVDDCHFTIYPAKAGRAYIGTECMPPVATQQSTWGSVKALYR